MLSITYVCCHSIFIVNFKVKSDCFSHWFVDQSWHSIFDTFMHEPWFYFYYWFDVLVVNSLTLSIPYFSWHSVFINDFKFNTDSVFADNLWISTGIAFLTSPCVSHDSHFASTDAPVMNSLTLLILYIYCHSVFIDDFKFNKDSVFIDNLWISSDSVFLQFHASAMTLFLLSIWYGSWIYWCCRLHTSAVTQYSLTISRFIVTLFSPVILRITRDIAFLTISYTDHDSISSIDLMRWSWNP
jgi:hypothetical protein